MSETPLDLIRRHIREAEERLKKSDTAAVRAVENYAPVSTQVSDPPFQPAQKERVSAIPLIVMSRDGTLIELNETACDWLGIRMEDPSTLRLRDFVHS
jgi:CRISPR/Cas system-associated protein Csx1